MNFNLSLRSNTAVPLVLALLVSPVLMNAASKDSGKTAGKGFATLRVVPEVAIPQSTFLIPSQPSEGRNPFYPQSVGRVVPQKVLKEPNSIDASAFVLNGITSPPKRTAMINGRTFEAGEEGEVRLASGGRMLIKCEEIKSESAVILVGGQRRELRMRSGL